MPLTAADIAEIIAGPGTYRVRVSPDGTVIISKKEGEVPDESPDEKPSSSSSRADRNRRYYERLKASKNNAESSESRLSASESVLIKTPKTDAPPPFSPPLPPPPSPPTPSPSAPTDPPTQSPSPKPRQSRRQKLIEEAASTSSMAVIPEEVATDEFRAVWAEWCHWRERLAREQGYAWTAIAARNILHKCVELGTRWAIGCIRAATGQYKGPVWESRHNPDDVRNKPITQPKGHTPVVDRSKHIPNKWKLPETQQQPPLPDLFSKD